MPKFSIPKTIKKLLVLIISSALLAQGAVAADQKIINWEVQDQQYVGGSTLNVWRNPTPNTFQASLCTGYKFEGCPYQDHITSQIYMPICTDDAQLACIEKVLRLSGGSVWKELTWQTDFGSEEVQEDKQLGIPKGTSASFWSDKSSSEGVVVAAAIEYNGTSIPLSPTRFNLSLLPATLQTTGAQAGRYSQINRNGQQQIGWSFSQCESQIAGKGYCANRISFEDGSRYRISLRVPENLSNWLFGRLGNAEISRTSISLGNVRLDVAADVTRVTQIKGQVNANDPSFMGWGDQMAAGSLTWFTPESQMLIPLIKVALQLGEPEPKSERLVWNLNSMPQTSSLQSTKCTGDGIIGVVTTDAPVYEASSPRLIDGELRYQLAGSHLNMAGNVLQSNYRLLLDKKVAKCLYPLSAIEPKASVSIVGASGAQQVSTVTTQVDDEWVVLSVGGLTFSAPEIRIKLESAPTPVVTPTPTPSPTKSPSLPSIESPAKVPTIKQKTLICIKGKTVKKVQSKTCPKGFTHKK